MTMHDPYAIALPLVGPDVYVQEKEGVCTVFDTERYRSVKTSSGDGSSRSAMCQM